MAKKKVKKKKPAAKKMRPAKKAKKKAVVKSKPAKSRKVVARAKPKAKPKAKPARRAPRGTPVEGEVTAFERRGLGPRTGGQSGDTQGIGARPGVDSESVEELLEEGQSYEAEVVDGVENAPEPDQGEVRTRQFKEDDVPEEYQERDE
jgi:hypothetical protein